MAEAYGRAVAEREMSRRMDTSFIGVGPARLIAPARPLPSVREKRKTLKPMRSERPTNNRAPPKPVLRTVSHMVPRSRLPEMTSDRSAAQTRQQRFGSRASPVSKSNPIKYPANMSAAYQPRSAKSSTYQPRPSKSVTRAEGRGGGGKKSRSQQQKSTSGPPQRRPRNGLGSREKSTGQELFRSMLDGGTGQAGGRGRAAKAPRAPVPRLGLEIGEHRGIDLQLIHSRKLDVRTDPASASSPPAAAAAAAAAKGPPRAAKRARRKRKKAALTRANTIRKKAGKSRGASAAAAKREMKSSRKLLRGQPSAERITRGRVDTIDVPTVSMDMSVSTRTGGEETGERAVVDASEAQGMTVPRLDMDVVNFTTATTTTSSRKDKRRSKSLDPTDTTASAAIMRMASIGSKSKLMTSQSHDASDGVVLAERAVSRRSATSMAAAGRAHREHGFGASSRRRPPSIHGSRRRTGQATTLTVDASNAGEAEADGDGDDCDDEVADKKTEEFCQVFLGGSCNPTTWRFDIAMPAFDAAGVTYYNPQVENWSPELVEVEARQKAAADMLLFVVDDKTRALASMLEASEYISTHRKVVLVVKEVGAESQIGGKAQDAHELKDLNRARSYLRDLATRHRVPVDSTVEDAVDRIIAHYSRRKSIHEATDDTISSPRGRRARAASALSAHKEAKEKKRKFLAEASKRILANTASRREAKATSRNTKSDPFRMGNRLQARTAKRRSKTLGANDKPDAALFTNSEKKRGDGAETSTAAGKRRMTRRPTTTSTGQKRRALSLGGAGMRPTTAAIRYAQAVA